MHCVVKAVVLEPLVEMPNSFKLFGLWSGFFLTYFPPPG